MAIARKEPPRRKRRLQDKLKNSALFILAAVLFAAIDIFSFVVWLSQILSGRGKGIVALVLWVSTSAFFVVVALAVVINNRRLDRRPEPKEPTSGSSRHH